MTLSPDASFWLDPAEQQFCIIDERWDFMQGSYELEDETLRIKFRPRLDWSGAIQSETKELVLTRRCDECNE